MALAYREFVDLGSAQQAYHDVFERLADPAALPTIFHCTAGKDRTGWAQAVLLTILGVPRDTILKDYALTGRYLAPQRQIVAARLTPGMGGGATRIFLAADPAYLRVAFSEVSARYHRFDNYLHQGLKLSDATLASIRHNFLTN
jgi:protein-tyrosine phosphatase